MFDVKRSSTVERTYRSADDDLSIKTVSSNGNEPACVRIFMKGYGTIVVPADKLGDLVTGLYLTTHKGYHHIEGWAGELLVKS